jgi:chromate reductase, NAD(P)H dehydrogenase (quinone)
MVKIIVFAGSLRAGSLNKKFAHQAAELAKAGGAEVEYIDLRDYPLPVYDGDIESKGHPHELIELKKKFMTADAFIISTPEYESMVPGALKNVLDWMSRAENKEDKKPELIDKPVLTLSASPGYYGAIRAMTQLRALLLHMKMIVLPETMALPDAGNAFDENGHLKDAKKKDQLEAYVKKLISTASKLKA